MGHEEGSYAEIIDLVQHHGKSLLSIDELKKIINIIEVGDDPPEIKEKYARLLVNYKDSLLEIKNTDPASFYVIPCEVHENFHKSKAKYRIFISCNRGRKTTAAIQEVYWYLTRTHPFRKITHKRLCIWYLGPQFKSFVDGVLYPKFILGESVDPYSPRFPSGNPYGFKWKADRHELVNEKGDVIVFKGAGPQAHLTDFASQNVDLIVVDEPIRGDIWGECTARLWTSNGSAIIVQTATEGLDWVYDTMVRPAQKGIRSDVEVFNLSAYDCPWFTREEIESRIAEILPHEGERGVLVRIMGKQVAYAENSLFSHAATSYYREYAIRLKNDGLECWRGEIFLGYDMREVSLSQHDEGRCRIWKEPDPDRDYVIGVDPCLGEGVTYASVTVMDSESLDVVADWHGQIEPETLGQTIVPALGIHYHYAWIWPENNNHGQSLIAALLDVRYPHIGSQIRDATQVGGRGQRQTKFGISTNARTKPIIMGLLRTYFRERLFGFLPPETVEEAASMSVEGDDDNKYTSKRTTDRVMSLGFCVYGLFEHREIRNARMKRREIKNNPRKAFTKKKLEESVWKPMRRGKRVNKYKEWKKRKMMS